MKNTNRIDVLNLFVNRFCEEARMAVDLPPDGQVQRALRRFAVAALAGVMAAKFQITGWARQPLLHSHSSGSVQQ